VHETTDHQRGALERHITDSGQRSRLDALLPNVYGELRRLARRQLDRERSDHSLDSVALVTEAYLKLAGHGDVRWDNRAHFFAISARAMRCILVDHARGRLAAKRGAGGDCVTLTDAALPGDSPDERLVALGDALDRLALVNLEASRTVECRYFGGLTLEETAAALGLSVITVRRRWEFAKAWLRQELGRSA
jgi:RNA polymerase sigma-70 factor (ECF subfamily)